MGQSGSGFRAKWLQMRRSVCSQPTTSGKSSHRWAGADRCRPPSPYTCAVRSNGVRLLVSLVLALTALGTPPAAAAPLVVYETPGCAGAPTWNIRYHLHWTSSTGKVLDPAGRQQALDSARGFAEQVGELSACAVRVRVEVVDEAGAYSEAVRHLTPGYDADFYRYPKEGDEGFSGQTQWRTAIFPVPEGSNWEPNALLLMHEWLHMVVNFYAPPNGWPRKDVHGACDRPDYLARRPGWSCMILPEWFGDLMTDKVLEDGVAKGLPPDQWAYQGTPEHPLHVEPDLWVTIDSRRVLVETEFTGDVRLWFSHSGAVVSDVLLPVVGGVEARRPLNRTRFGAWTVCATTPEVEAFRSATVCQDYIVYPRIAPLLKIKRGSRQAILRVKGPLLGRVARVRFLGETIQGRPLRKQRTVVLRSRAIVRYPPWPLSTSVFMEVTTRPFTVGGVDWPRGSWGRQIRQ